MNITTILCGIGRTNLTNKFHLCDEGNILSNKYKLLKIGKLIGFKPKLATRYPIKVKIWRMGNGRKKKYEIQNVFKAFSEKVANINNPDSLNFYKHNDV